MKIFNINKCWNQINIYAKDMKLKYKNYKNLYINNIYPKIILIHGAYPEIQYNV